MIFLIYKMTLGMKYTQEDIQYLSKFESNFNTAIKANYTRNIPKKDVEKMVEIYNRVNGKALKLCTYCSSSVLSFLKDIGKEYFEVQAGIEPQLETNELAETVAIMTQCNEGIVENTDVAKAKEDNTKNNTTKNTKRNAKYTTKQSK